jgi:hypothetical protein
MAHSLAEPETMNLGMYTIYFGSNGWFEWDIFGTSARVHFGFCLRSLIEFS